MEKFSGMEMRIILSKRKRKCLNLRILQGPKKNQRKTSTESILRSNRVHINTAVNSYPSPLTSHLLGCIFIRCYLFFKIYLFRFYQERFVGLIPVNSMC